MMLMTQRGRLLRGHAQATVKYALHNDLHKEGWSSHYDRLIIHTAFVNGPSESILDLCERLNNAVVSGGGGGGSVL